MIGNDGKQNMSPNPVEMENFLRYRPTRDHSQYGRCHFRNPYRIDNFGPKFQRLFSLALAGIIANENKISSLA